MKLENRVRLYREKSGLDRRGMGVQRARTAGDVLILGLGASYTDVFSLGKFVKLYTWDRCTFPVSM